MVIPIYKVLPYFVIRTYVQVLGITFVMSTRTCSLCSVLLPRSSDRRVLHSPATAAVLTFLRELVDELFSFRPDHIRAEVRQADVTPNHTRGILRR